MKTLQNLLCICEDLHVIGYEYEKLVALGFPTHFPLSPNFKQFYKLSGQNYGQSDKSPTCSPVSTVLQLFFS